jgi:hypothetical protein
MKLAQEMANNSKRSLLIKMKNEIDKIRGTILDATTKGRGYVSYAIDASLPPKYRDRIKKYFDDEGFGTSTYSNSISLDWSSLMDEKCAQCGKDHFDAACSLE